MVARYGRWLLLTQDLDRSERFFDRFGGAAVLIGRMMPGIRSFIALPAGIAQMPLLRFHLYTFIGSLPWCLGLAYAGQVLGSRWNTDPRLSALFHKIDLFLLGVAVLAGIWFVRRRLTGCEIHGPQKPNESRMTFGPFVFNQSGARLHWDFV
jgi:membrane protein DedA with SNARE-associated domain